MRSRSILAWLLLAVLAASACGRRQTVSRPASAGRVPAPAGGASAEAPRPGHVETGYASWYGDPYHGRRAANGEIYDKNQLTAAHLTMPFETWVKVTNLENSSSVTVRITDRGPFVKGRIIDVSQEAARQLRMIAAGTALVRLEVLSTAEAPSSAPTASYAVQVGSFRERQTAEQLRERLQTRYGGAFVERYDGSDGVFYRVRVGPKQSVPEARNLAAQLQRENLPGFVVRLSN